MLLSYWYSWLFTCIWWKLWKWLNRLHRLRLDYQKTVNPPLDFTLSWQMQYFSGTYINRRLLLGHLQKQSTWLWMIVLARLYGLETCLGRLVSTYYLYQSVVTIKSPSSWETTLLQNIAQNISSSDSIMLETLFKSIKWRSSISKGLTILPTCSLRTLNMSNSRYIGLN